MMRTRCILLCLVLSLPAVAQVTPDRLLQPDGEPGNWLSYSRSYSNQRHSPLSQVNARNAGKLQLQWVWQARSLEKFEATPLVVDGVLY
ncbi:MAG: PQQ-dependent dehydrogenase, methanol/ethanol family, partial [Pseudomonadota bacterium]